MSKLDNVDCSKLVNYVFFDSEWTCWKSKKENNIKRRELLSVGVVVTNNRFEEVGRFYRVVKPFREPILSKFCKKLTGVKQEDVNTAKQAYDVLSEMDEWLKAYDYGDKIFVWGASDKLCFDMLAKKTRSYVVKEIANAIVDLEPIIGDSVKAKGGFTNTISLVNMLKLYRIDTTGDSIHNALVDAELLKTVYNAYVKDFDIDSVFLKSFSASQINMEREYYNRINGQTAECIWCLPAEKVSI